MVSIELIVIVYKKIDTLQVKFKYRIKLRHKATLRFIAFNIFSASQNIVSNSGIMYQLSSLFSNLLSSSKYRFKYRQNAPLPSLFSFFLQFQIV